MIVTAAMIQPGYLPWLGYFDQMAQADLFIHYDDVQFSRKSWHHRNRLKSPVGEQWLTVPVEHAGKTMAINQVAIANPAWGRGWGTAHLAMIRDWYRKAPFLGDYLPALEDLLEQTWDRLINVDVALVTQMAAWLGVDARTAYASDFGIPLSLDTTARPLQICQAAGVTRLILGPTARAYVEPGAFQEAGIEILWHSYQPEPYSQLHGPFLPYMSALDAILMLGPEASCLIGQGRLERAA